MELLEYQKHAMSTSLGTKIDKEYIYCLMKCFGEMGELKRAFNSDEEDREYNIKKEMGDVLWYIATASYYLDINWDEICEVLRASTLSIDIYKPVKDSTVLMEKLFDALSVVHEATGKLYRDNNGEVTEKFKRLVYKQFVYILYVLRHYSFYYIRGGLGDVLQTNIDKLQLRKKTSTLHGSGDNRETEVNNIK